jgi:hypothetical protein
MIIDVDVGEPVDNPAIETLGGFMLSALDTLDDPSTHRASADAIPALVLP